jgi:hypothetical protein
MCSRPNNGFPMRYFFHVKDGKQLLDQNGVELADMDSVKKEAVSAAAELLSAIHGADFWTGEPWKLWVTDKPKGAGKTLLTLRFTAELVTDHHPSLFDSPNDHLTDTSGPH